MANDRLPCCTQPSRRPPCGTRWAELKVWASATTGKGVKVVTLEAEERGKGPFFAQPVGFDGRVIHLAQDFGCDTEKLLHEVCHWLIAPRARRGQVNYGLGPGAHVIGDPESDNEEVTVMLLELKLAPHFRLAAERIAKPDYNVANRRNVDWAECEARAAAVFAAVSNTLPAV